MFGEKEKCCCCQPRINDFTLQIQYAQKINELKYQLDKANRTIADLAETNKYLSRRSTNRPIAKDE